MKNIFLDLDGVVANFEGHFIEKFNRPLKGIKDPELWKLVNADPFFFEEVPPFDGAKEFYDWLNNQCLHYGYHLSILTACPNDEYQRHALQKKRWVENHLSKDVWTLPIMGSRNKYLFYNNLGDILIDDFIKNIDAWNTYVGPGIHHKDFNSTKQMLNLSVFKD